MMCNTVALLLALACTALAIDSTTYAALVSGVPAQYNVGGGSPGILQVFGADAAPLALDSDGEAVAAATVYPSSNGRVCLFSHGNMIAGGGNFTLVQNCVKWGTNSATNFKCILHDYSSSKAKYQALGCNVTGTNAFASTTTLDGVSVLVMDTEDMDNNGVNTSWRIAQVRTFLQNGGTLIASGLGWYWTGYRTPPTITAHPGTLLLAAAGLAVSDDGASLSGSFATVTPAANYVASDNNVLLALKALAGARAGNATLQAYANKHVNEVSALFVGGLDNTALLDLKAAFAQQYESTCASFTYNVSSSRPARSSETSRRSCMSMAYGLPTDARGTDWSVESKNFPGDIPSASTVTVTVSVPRTRTAWISTGYFVSAGSSLVLEIPQSETTSGLAVQIGCWDDVLHSDVDWSRWQEITESVDLLNATTTVGVKFAGPVYINVNTASSSSLSVKMTGKLSSMPIFKSGTTTANQWNSAVNTTNSMWGELETTDLIVTLPISSLKKVTDMQSVADYWQRVITCEYNFRGISPFAHKQRYVVDVQISAGSMHSGYPIMMYLSESDDFVMADPNWSHWGEYHEMGHNLQDSQWTWTGLTEITVNIFSLYCEKNITGKWSWHPPSAKAAAAAAYKLNPNYTTWLSDPFLALQMYAEIGEKWGWQLYTEVFQEYDGLPSSERPKTDQQKRDQWMIRLSRHIGRSLATYFDVWGIPISNDARQNVSDLWAWDYVPPNDSSSSSSSEAAVEPRSSSDRCAVALWLFAALCSILAFLL